MPVGSLGKEQFFLVRRNCLIGNILRRVGDGLAALFYGGQHVAFQEGLLPLTVIANLQLGESSSTSGLSPAVAVFDREKVGKDPAPPCVKLSDGTGVWIRLGDPYAAGSKDFCPSHKPQFYTR